MFFFSKMFCANFCHKKGFSIKTSFLFFKSVSLNLFFNGAFLTKNVFPHVFQGFFFLFFFAFFPRVFLSIIFSEEFCFRNVS